MATVPFPSANPTPGSPCQVVACRHGPGYRFRPTDSQLIVDFLDRRIKNGELPYLRKIKDINFYGYNPEHLAKILPGFEDVWYCFTQRNRKHPNGSRPNRVAGEGYWKATGADGGIKVKGKTVGFKRALVFYRGKKKTNWIMHEFTRATPSPDRNHRRSNQDMKLDDWVLCRFYERKKGRSRINHNRHDDDDDDEDQIKKGRSRINHYRHDDDDDEDEISENSSSGSVNVGECDGVVAAVEDNMGSAMTMPGRQLMYNDINDGDLHQVLVASVGGNINTANVPPMPMAAGRNYYYNNDISDVPPMDQNAANAQLGNMYNQGPILDQSGLNGSSDSDFALPPFYGTAEPQPLPQEGFYGYPQPQSLPQEGFYGTPQPQPQEGFPQPGIPHLQHSDAALQGTSQTIPETHNAAAAEHTSSALEDYFDFEAYFNTWKMLI